MRVNICGIGIDNLSFKNVVDIIVNHIVTKGNPRYVVTPNAQHILMLQNDKLFREIYRNAFLVVPDGVSILWGARYLGTPLKGRVNGTDLLEALCRVGAKNCFKIFFMGGRPDAAVKAKEKLLSRYANLKIVGTHCPPYGFESKSHELDIINTKIYESKPDILFVGLGAPKQEYWIYKNYKKLGVPMTLGIGVSFELVAEIVKRAPIFMQKIGVEWFFRLIVEPRRLWKRYIYGNPFFIMLLLKQKTKQSQ